MRGYEDYKDYEDTGEPRCTACGEPLGDAGRVCSVDEWVELCWSCAVRRGGSYDSDQERWTELPDVSDLADGPPHAIPE